MLTSPRLGNQVSNLRETESRTRHARMRRTHPCGDSQVVDRVVLEPSKCNTNGHLSQGKPPSLGGVDSAGPPGGLSTRKFHELEDSVRQPDDGAPVDPVPQHYKVLTFPLPMNWTVEMAEDDRIVAFRIPRLSEALAQILVADRGTRRVVAARVGARRSQRDADVRVYPAKEPARDAVSEHPPQDFVTVVARAEAVAVGKEDPASLERQRDGHVGEGDVELAREILADPEIVISADIENGHPATTEVAQGLEHPDETLRDRVAVLEPEVEEVPVHVQCGALVMDLVEEGEEIPLAGEVRFGRALSEMRIGDEIGAPRLGHEASV